MEVLNRLQGFRGFNEAAQIMSWALSGLRSKVCLFNSYMVYLIIVSNGKVRQGLFRPGNEVENFYLTGEKTNFTLLTVLCIRGRVGCRRGDALVMM